MRNTRILATECADPEGLSRRRQDAVVEVRMLLRFVGPRTAMLRVEGLSEVEAGGWIRATEWCSEETPVVLSIQIDRGRLSV